MNTVRRALLLAAVATAAAGTVVRSQQGPTTDLTALTGAAVIDVAAGTTVSDAVIVIDGDRITAFGGPATPIPSDATVVDLSGRFIIPGLVDSHVHYQPFLGELFLNFGVTSVVNLGAGGALGDAYWRSTQSPDVRTPRAVRDRPSAAEHLYRPLDDAGRGPGGSEGMAEGRTGHGESAAVLAQQRTDVGMGGRGGARSRLVHIRALRSCSELGQDRARRHRATSGDSRRR